MLERNSTGEQGPGTDLRGGPRGRVNRGVRDRVDIRQSEDLSIRFIHRDENFNVQSLFRLVHGEWAGQDPCPNSRLRTPGRDLNRRGRVNRNLRLRSFRRKE